MKFSLLSNLLLVNPDWLWCLEFWFFCISIISWLILDSSTNSFSYFCSESLIIIFFSMCWNCFSIFFRSLFSSWNLFKDNDFSLLLLADDISRGWLLTKPDVFFNELFTRNYGISFIWVPSYSIERKFIRISLSLFLFDPYSYSPLS